MNIAIIHYHLNRGGVSRVVANQLRALNSVLGDDETCRVAIIHGGRADGWPQDLDSQLSQLQFSLHSLPSLDYDDRPVAEPEVLADQLRTLLGELYFPPLETVLHVHNHCLGKNASLPGAISRLAEDGFALLLQVHDFAEDFRPRNYRLLSDALGDIPLQAIQYPQAPQIHYAVLSRRDESVLSDAGIARERLHWLPNPVPEPENLPDKNVARKKLWQQCGISESERYLLYPVRGIRRKNLGELLLWSILVPKGTQTAVTLAPLNPNERVYYDAWEALATELDLPCRFDTGGPGKLEFAENLAAADLVLTTSIAEGFGMVFLEAWLSGLNLVGRDLPEITADFKDAGLCLDGLYERLQVPLSWVGEADFREATRRAYESVLSAYGMPLLSEDDFERGFACKIREECVDFGDLNEPLQEKVIRRVAGDSKSRDELLQINPQIANACASSSDEIVEQNRLLISQTYSLSASGKQLLELYQKIISSQREPPRYSTSDENSLLGRFLDLTRFRLIRT